MKYLPEKVNSFRKCVSEYQSSRFSFVKTIIVIFLLAFSWSCSQPESRWLRGNMHTHTFWSDGDEFPEVVAKWYKDHGYDFLVHTDHNQILEGERWRSFPADHQALASYVELFGKDWVEMRPDTADEAKVQVRLKTLAEYRDKYEEAGKYLLIMGNEISCAHAVHLVTLQQDRVIPAAKGTAEERTRMIGEVVQGVEDYRKQTGVNVFPALAHPNFRWAITAEMMLENPDLRFFEVYNGHPQVNNAGDTFRAGTERMWDIVLSNRLSDGGKLLYGIATDDTHNYHGGGASPGKGWVMIRADNLNVESILDGLDRGDFYASTGVRMKDIRFNGKTLSVEIDPQEGAGYEIEFIGTKKGFDRSSTPATDADGVEIENTTRRYSDDIGVVLASSKGTRASYRFTGNELYVRARITSTSDQIDPNSGKVAGKQQAWIQPQVQKL